LTLEELDFLEGQRAQAKPACFIHFLDEKLTESV
jgi:hypothetical protein